MLRVPPQKKWAATAASRQPGVHKALSAWKQERYTLHLSLESCLAHPKKVFNILCSTYGALASLVLFQTIVCVFGGWGRVLFISLVLPQTIGTEETNTFSTYNETGAQ